MSLFLYPICNYGKTSISRDISYLWYFHRLEKNLIIHIFVFEVQYLLKVCLNRVAKLRQPPNSLIGRRNRTANSNARTGSLTAQPFIIYSAERAIQSLLLYIRVPKVPQ